MEISTSVHRENGRTVVSVEFDTEESTETSVSTEAVEFDADPRTVALRDRIDELERDRAQVREVSTLTWDERNRLIRRVNVLTKRAQDAEARVEALPENLMADYVQAREDRDALIVQRDQLEARVKVLIEDQDRLAKMANYVQTREDRDAEAQLAKVSAERDRLAKEVENESKRADRNYDWAVREQAALSKQIERTEKVEAQLVEFDRDRHTERDRAKRAERELARRTDERDEREAARHKLEGDVSLALNERDQLAKKVEAETKRAEKAETQVRDLNREVEKLLIRLDRIRWSVWQKDLDEPMENRLPEVTKSYAGQMAAVVSFVRATVGQEA